MMKVSPFLRQETTGTAGFSAEGDMRCGTKRRKVARGFPR